MLFTIQMFFGILVTLCLVASIQEALKRDIVRAFSFVLATVMFGLLMLFVHIVAGGAY